MNLGCLVLNLDLNRFGYILIFISFRGGHNCLTSCASIKILINPFIHLCELFNYCGIK